MSRSSIRYNPKRNQFSELEEHHHFLKVVADNIGSIIRVANTDLTELESYLEQTTGFVNIDVVIGDTPKWDAKARVLTIPSIKGDTGEPITITNIQALPDNSFKWVFSDGTVYQTPNLTGKKGDKGDRGDKGDSLELDYIDDRGDGSFVWVFSDGSQYITPNLRGPRGFKGEKGSKGDKGELVKFSRITHLGGGQFMWMFDNDQSYITPDLRGSQGEQGIQGKQGDRGFSVHHIKPTETTDEKGKFAQLGETDTYTFYGDVEEQVVLGSFKFTNGFSDEDTAESLGIMRKNVYDVTGSGSVDNSHHWGGLSLSDVGLSFIAESQEHYEGLKPNLTSKDTVLIRDLDNNSWSLKQVLSTEPEFIDIELINSGILSQLEVGGELFNRLQEIEGNIGDIDQLPYSNESIVSELTAFKVLFESILDKQDSLQDFLNSIDGLGGDYATDLSKNYLWKNKNLSDLKDFSAARSNLGLGELATKNKGDVGRIIVEDLNLVLPISRGGTGGTTVEEVRAGLELGDMATRNLKDINPVRRDEVNLALGFASASLHEESTAYGYKTIAAGNMSTALGSQTCVKGVGGLGVGFRTEVDGKASTAVGLCATAYGLGSLSIGHYSHSSDEASIAVGRKARAVGYGALALGSSAAALSDHSIAIGHNAICLEPNHLQLGAQSGSGSPVVINTAVPITSRSDARDKADIRDSKLGLEFIMSLRPVQWRWDYRSDYLPELPEDFSEWAKEDRDKWVDENNIQNLDINTKDGSKKRTRFHNGFIAQEVKESADYIGIDFAGYQDNSVLGSADDTKGLVYEEFIAPLVKAVQEQQKIIEELQDEVEGLRLLV